MRRCVHRSQPRKSRIFSDLHLASERPEAGALVEAESGRVIEGAGVRPKTPDRTRPGTFNGAIHQPSSCWPADQRSGQAEEGQFALILLTEIELEQPRAVAVVSQPVNLHIGGADDGCELGVGKQQPAEPEPVLADGAIESTVLGRIGGEPVKTPIRIRRLRP